MKFSHVVAASLLACLCQLAASLTISVPDPVLEGTNLVISCITSGVGAGSVVLNQNGQVSGVSGRTQQSNITVRAFDLGAVDRSNNGTTYQCVSGFDGSMSAEVTLDVHWLPSFSLSVPSGSVQQYLEGSSQVVTVQGLDLGKPPAPGVEWSVNEGGLTSGGGVTVSDTSISFIDVRRSHSGEYSAVVGNVHGNVTADFTVDVTYPPTLGAPPPEVFVMIGDMFVFNCTPIPGNPVKVNITFRKDGSPVTPGGSVTVDGPLLTIPSVQRSDSGNYSCTVSNTAGMTAVYHSLTVVVPPGKPENLAFPSIGPYSVTVTWNPPSDKGGSPNPLNYTVALTATSDGQSVSANQTAQTQLTFTALSHSENYTVSVVAVNSLSQQGPSAVGTVRTRDIPPVIGTVIAEALSLSEVQVTVTLSDTGGQPVEEYTVSINGTAMTFSGSADLQLIGNITGLPLMNGVTYTVSVVARNSIGDSKTFFAMVFVPFSPNITMQPVAVPPDETTTRCCAGVRVFLEHPSDPTLVFTAQVSTEGSPFTARDVTRSNEAEDVVYVQGLQAGTPYNIRLTARNNFGSVTMEVSTTPLIGYPSDPSMPVVSVEGSSVSIQLSTRYPGTNARGQFRFSLIFSAASTAKRQSLQPTEVRVDPTGLESSVTTTHTLTDVTAGSYSVSVMAENEHGTSQVVTVTFLVEGSVDTAVIIGVVVAVVIVILLLILAIFIIVLVYMKRRDTKAMYKPKNEGSGDADYKEMVDTNSTDPLAPHYEDPSTLERQAPPPVVTYKKEEEAAAVQPAPVASGIVYADLDFSRQQAFGSKKPPEKKKPDPIEAVVYSEVRLMTPQEKQQGQERGEGEVGGDGEEPHSPTTIM